MGDKNRVWERVFNLIRMATGNVDVVNKGDLQTQVDDLDESLSICLKNTGIVDIKNKGNLQKQVNDLDKEVQKCFQSASNGKELIADAVTGKGVPTLGTDTFAIMAENIKKIKTEPRLQNKTVVLDVETHSATIEADKDYDGIEKVTASITLQEKTVELSTVGQVIVPDSGMVLSKVNIPAIDGNASESDVLAERTFGSENGVKLTGTMPDNGAWVGETTGSGKVIIPSGYHNGSGYVSGEGAYNAGVSAGAAGTKVGTAAAGDVLAGKTFTNAESAGITGTMSDNGGKTVEASSVTNEGGYTYFAVPLTGYYDTDSVIKIQNQKITKTKVGSITGNGSIIVPEDIDPDNILQSGDFIAVIKMVYTTPDIKGYGTAIPASNYTRSLSPVLTYNSSTRRLSATGCKGTANLAVRTDVTGEWEWYDARATVEITIDVYI